MNEQRRTTLSEGAISDWWLLTSAALYAVAGLCLIVDVALWAAIVLILAATVAFVYSCVWWSRAHR